MVRFLIHRPIAVLMTFLAFFILGGITYLHIPISLLPDIPIPEITVNIDGGNTSARDLENTAVAPVRQQLLQVGKVRDMQSETRDGHAVIRLYFEYGVNTDLAFIEVNEKIDASMNSLPRDFARPHVVKANATDIPVFYLHMTLKPGADQQDGGEQAFLEMSTLAQEMVKRRIEQLPQVAMVDMTGTVDRQVRIVPDVRILQATGITIAEIADVLQQNNIEPGSMTVHDGHYAYNISFSSVMRTVEDVQHIFLKKNGRLFQLRDLAAVTVETKDEEGISLYQGKRAVSLAIIKQADEPMGKLTEEMDKTITYLQSMYPDVVFSKSQSQSELLEYTIANLQQNLILAFVFVCLVSAFFMRDIRSPFIIGASMFVSLIVSLLFFYLFNISLNIVSLTGLILALGMMIDNSIIVTDNIDQYHKQRGLPIDEACIQGTNDVIAPMLTSSFTTISIFVPLIFMSGIAGALFFDQAFSVSVGLLVSYLTGIILLPVLYKLMYTVKIPLFSNTRFFPERQSPTAGHPHATTLPERVYHCVANWVFANKAFSLVLTLLIFPICWVLFLVIPKEKMPTLSQSEMLVQVDWNESVHLDENRDRSTQLVQATDGLTAESSTMVGRQQFLLNQGREQTFSETEFYFRVQDPTGIAGLRKHIDSYMNTYFPQALVTYAPTGTVFERIFMTAEPDLRLEYYARHHQVEMPQDTLQNWKERLRELTGYEPLSIAYQKQMNLHVDREKLLLYGIPYNRLHSTLQTALKHEEVTTLRSYQQYLPIKIGQGNGEINAVLANTRIQQSAAKEGERSSAYPLQAFVTSVTANGAKTIVSGRNGAFIPFDFERVEHPEATLKLLQDSVRSDTHRDIHFSGSFFTNREMLDELLLVLGVSILLMYFILAAQFESFLQPLIVLLEIPVAVAAALALLWVLGHSLNLMSAIGIIVTSGIIINDSILKLDIMNQLRKQGVELITAIHEAGRRRLNAILMTSLTSIVCMLPLLFSNDMGSELEKPLALATIAGMVVGTPVSLFIVPLVYWFIYRNRNVKV